ncbi:MAG: hypothetical protein ACLFVR_13550 [Thiohalospira sp.]
MKKNVFILKILLSSIITKGQNCNCLENFEYLKIKIENDYAGFNDKVNDSNNIDYERYSNFYENKASEINTTNRCMLLMEEWLKYFQDKHGSVN